jgi:hypothetical protein
VAGGKLLRSGFMPLYIGRDAVPRFAPRGSAEYRAVVEYLEAVTQEAGLNGAFRETDEMVELTQRGWS